MASLHPAERSDTLNTRGEVSYPEDINSSACSLSLFLDAVLFSVLYQKKRELVKQW
jgi:hypothetical protein